MVHRVKHRREREEEAHKDEAAALTSKWGSHGPPGVVLGSSWDAKLECTCENKSVTSHIKAASFPPWHFSVILLFNLPFDAPPTRVSVLKEYEAGESKE
jgi:hypothetical protein